jgi:hypothetical protein
LGRWGGFDNWRTKMKKEISMCGNKYYNKIIITMQDIMVQMNISDKTLHRMIEIGDLPDFTYGSRWSKKKGWHAAVLERHAMEKYEKSRSLKNNICDVRQVGGKNMVAVPLNSKKQRASKGSAKKTKCTPASKSLVARGFSE